jgi:ATP-dependent helicase/nuclease subunit B
MTPATQTPLAPATRRWADVLAGIEVHLRQQGAPASRALVLVPYAQLMDAGRRAWAEVHPSGFAPRFESSRNWAQSLQPFVPAATDLSGDMARDALVAAHLLDRVARGRLDPALKPVMVARLVESARQLAPLAAARAPAERSAWADVLRSDVSPGSPTLQWESLLASLALVWAGASRYPTDVLWSPLAEPGTGFDALVVLQGFQPDPLAAALLAHWGERAIVIRLHEDGAAPSAVHLHACGDAEDEAQRAAACALAHANAGRHPVALVANDRLLTRRVSALLHGAGLAVRDETGWKLSTTHAAAQLMNLLRAADRQARMDDVLDWLKLTRFGSVAQVSQLEKQARTLGLSHGAAAWTHPKLVPCCPAGAGDLLMGLQAPRPLAHWLGDLAQALRGCGWWDAFNADQAGQQILQALRLGDGAAQELSVLTSGLSAESDAAASEPAARRGPARMNLRIHRLGARHPGGRELHGA